MTDSDKERKTKISKYIGNNIFHYRKNKGLTREELAEKSNLSSNHIYELEMGNSMPTIITLIDICNALNISFSQLLDLSLFDNKTEYSESFLDNFNKLTNEEQSFIIKMIKLLSEN